MFIHTGNHFPGLVRGKLRVSAALVSLYGIYAFIKRGFLGCMFLRVHFPAMNPRSTFIIDYIAVMVLCVVIGAAVVNLLGKSKKA